MTIDITGIAVAVISLLGVLITRYVIPWIKSRTTEAQRRDIREWAAVAVAAAEMIFKGPEKGKEKLAYAMQYLEDRGIKMDDVALRGAVEAALHEMKLYSTAPLI